MKGLKKERDESVRDAKRLEKDKQDPLCVEPSVL